MKFLGIEVSVVLILQFGFSLLLIGLYTARNTLNEQHHTYRSRTQMLLAAAFVSKNHPSRSTPHELLGLTELQVSAQGSRLSYFGDRLKKFQADGQLPQIDQSPKTNILELLWAIALAPIMGFGMTIVAHEEWKTKDYLTENTHYRKGVISIISALAISDLFLAGVIAHFAPNKLNTAWIIALSIPLISFISSLIAFGITVLQQQSWKEYWTDSFLQIMAFAATTNDHSLSVQAFAYHEHFDSQPDIPIPGKLSLYTGIFTVIQGLILLIAKWVGIN